MEKGPCVFFPDQQGNPPPHAPFRPGSHWFWLYPAAVWLGVLAAIFVTEYTVMLVLPWLLPSQPRRILEASVDAVLLVAVVAPLIWWTVVRPLKEVIRLRTQFLIDLFARIEKDRQGTAYELHDGIGQSLSLMVSGLRTAHESATDPEAAARSERLLKLARQALTDVKRLALGLRPSLLDELGLAPALERLVGNVQENHAMELSLEAADVAGLRFAEPIETAVFRIVQEALANVVVHSGAKTASVVIHRRGGELTVTIADDGRGFDPADAKVEKAGRLGLIGMRERATLLGGKFAIQSAPGDGTRVTATIPLGG